jgi:hypothetical protein
MKRMATFVGCGGITRRLPHWAQARPPMAAANYLPGGWARPERPAAPFGYLPVCARSCR